MAYYSGSAVDMTAVRTALVAACTAEGWSWDSFAEVLSKGGVFVRLRAQDGYLELLGRTSASGGAAPGVVRMGPMISDAMTYPVSYDVFVFEAEVYMVINYSVDRFQFCGFGKSTAQGLPGTGNWVMATQGQTPPLVGFTITATSGGNNGYISGTPMPFWGTVRGSLSSGANDNWWVHADLDGMGWLPATNANASAIGVAAAAPLIGLLPNSWNSEGVLLPIRVFQQRSSNKNSLTAELLNARWTRNDNYEPGQVIDIGSERWKIFPGYVKNITARNGVDRGFHSGTFAWAVRYEGP